MIHHKEPDVMIQRYAERDTKFNDWIYNENVGWGLALHDAKAGRTLCVVSVNEILKYGHLLYRGDENEK